ncbi:dihydrofolate reductase family protein [Pseudonocardia sp. DSM 110487]|uniref:dihydrofolate reductase family protein n=1 Tax=Pseudonocardia sp. DSM 110487 TaxID=2865833 RepID=UPI001C699E81|nr:dihydrofolate reductase family protein [Pseudonocardia sp. DSM 110487]QYN35925.1 dihydrofolate reductase family protein [Pseudonocardia sp. DSM 110487]
MGRIVVTEFISLDGVVEAPGGEDFKHPNWAFAFDRVDEIHLMTFPIVLGTGRRLFGETPDKSTWKLTASRTVGEGIPITVFQRADQK